MLDRVLELQKARFAQPYLQLLNLSTKAIVTIVR